MITFIEGWNVYTKQFIESKVLGELYRKYLISELSSNLMVKNYLEKLKINLNLLIDTFIKNINVTIKEDIIYLSLNNNIKINGESLNSIIGILENGNLQLKGTGVFKKGINWIQKNIKHYYFITKFLGD